MNATNEIKRAALGAAHTRETGELDRIEAQGLALVAALEPLVEKIESGSATPDEIGRAVHLRDRLGIVQERLTLLRGRVHVYRQITKGR